MRSSKNVRSNTWALRTVSKRTAVTAGPASICSGNKSARGRVAQQRATTCSSRLGTAPSRPCRCGHGRDPGPAQIRPLHCAALPCLDVLCARQLQDRVAEQLPRGIGGVHLKGPCCARREEREATSEAIGPVPMLYATARYTLRAANRTVRWARCLSRAVHCRLCCGLRISLAWTNDLGRNQPLQEGKAVLHRVDCAQQRAHHQLTLLQRMQTRCSNARRAPRPPCLAASAPPAPQCARANAKCPCWD